MIHTKPVMDLTTNSNVVSDALKYVNGKAEKLSAVAADAEKESVASYEEEEEIEEYQTTMSEETEETINQSFCDS
jgi:hypothetical protein